MPVVVLSDGEPCKVRQLGLFELDGKGREIIGPYRYTLLLASGQIVEDEYDIRALTYTPTKPEMPPEQIKQGSPEWYQLQEFDTYQAAIVHEKLRIESYEGYVNDIAAYILTTCVDPADRNRIVTVMDWDKVQAAALVPELTLEGLADCLASTFPGFVWGQADIGRLAVIER